MSAANMRLDVPRVLSRSHCLKTLYPAVLVFIRFGLHIDIEVTESPSRYINVVCHEDPVGGDAGRSIITLLLPTLHRIAQIVPGLRCELACCFVMIRYCGERSCSVVNGLVGTYSFESDTYSFESGTYSLQVARIAFRWHI
jgi:hypothetical protein